MDFNDHRADSLLGTVTHELAGLATDAEQEGLMGKILSGGKDRGELRYSLSYYPVLTPTKNPDGTVVPPPESSTGIVRLTIHQAKDLDVTKVHGTISSHAQVFLGSGQSIFKTPTIKSSNEPTFEVSTEFLVANKFNSSLTIRLEDDKEFGKVNLGAMTVKLQDVLEAKDKSQDWFPLAGVRSGRIRLSAVWKPLLVAGSLDGASNYVPPIGVMRIWIKKAVDVKNVEAAMGGKSDPYVRIMLNNHILARTEVINNNLNPEFDAILYVPVHTTRERLLLEVMDYQNLTKDRTLGTVDLGVGDYVGKVGTDRTAFSSTGPQDRSDPINLGRGQGTKGKLLYEAKFIPCVNLKGGVTFAAANGDAATASPFGPTDTALARKTSFASVKSHRPAASVTSMESYRDVPQTPARLETLDEKAPLASATLPASSSDDKEDGLELSHQELLSSRECRRISACRRKSSVPVASQNLESSSSKRFRAR